MYSDFYQEEDLKASLDQYTRSMKHNRVAYFEVHEFEFIVDHYLQIGDVALAEKAVNNALKIHPNNPDILRRLAQIYNSQRRFREAVQILNKAFESFGAGKDVDYYLILGEAYLGLGKANRSQDLFAKAVEMADDDFFEISTSIAAIYQQEGYHQETIRFLKTIVDEDPSLLFEIAFAYLSLFDFEHAIENFDSYIRFYPYSADAWMYLSRAYSSMEKYDLAEDAMLYAVAIQPTNEIYLKEMAILYETQELYIEALNIYQEMLQSDISVDEDLFISIGNISFQLNQFENAQKNYQLANKIAPGSPKVLYSMGLLELELENYLKAKSFLLRALDKDPENVEYQSVLAQIYYFLDESEKAEQLALKILDVNPFFIDAWSVLVDVYFYSKQYRKALAASLWSNRLIGEDWENLTKIAAIYWLIDKPEKASDFLKKAYDSNAASLSFFLEYMSEVNQNTENFIKELNITAK
ncbi:MAG: tetratricopeptide repeat protein [Bacteroidales bacterium]|nr:tetratricopeptide repeat protein [Bacteroidales bacterium]